MPSCIGQKTLYSNPIPNVPSGAHYARFRVSGKSIWKSLKTDKFTVAHLRLGDMQNAERVIAMRAYGHLRDQHSTEKA